MIKNVVGFAAGLLLANGFEWYAHKHLLHGISKERGQPRYSPTPKSMTSHWTHHKFVRTTNFRDHGYEEGLSNDRTRNELIAVITVAAAMTAITWKINKGLAVSHWYCAANYFLTHRKAHLDPEYAKKRIPWHYDHHMNSQQDANWCVTRPWFDYIMGTRIASSEDLIESNPLGIRLPKWIEKPLNKQLRELFPQAFDKLEQNIKQEIENKATGFEEVMPDLDFYAKKIA